MAHVEETYRGAWQAYQQAFADLARRDGTDANGDGTSPIDRQGMHAANRESDRNRADALLMHSREMRTMIRQLAASDNATHRIQANARFFAAAVADLQAAAQLLSPSVRTDNAGTLSATPASFSASTVLPGVRAVLDAPLRVERAAFEDGAAHSPQSPQEARAALKTLVGETFTALTDDTAASAQLVFNDGVVTVLVGMSGAAILDGVLNHLPTALADVGHHTVAFIKEAIDKLFDAIGEANKKDVLDQCLKAWGDFENGGIRNLLNDVYERPTLEATAQTLILPTTTPEQCNEAANLLKALPSAHQHDLAPVHDVLGNSVIGIIKGAIAGTQVGRPVLAVLYLLVLGYVVFRSGDYLDANRFKDVPFADAVPGVLTVLREQLR